MKMITKAIKTAILDLVTFRIDIENYGLLSQYRVKASSLSILEDNKIEMSNSLCLTDEVKQNGVVIAKIKYRYASRKHNGFYKMLKPQITYV